MIEVGLAGALLAGLLSFLSPCVLPLVPAYLSYISGVSVDALRHPDAGAGVRRRAVIQSLWFVLGFSLVFVMLGGRRRGGLLGAVRRPRAGPAPDRAAPDPGRAHG